MPSGEVFRQARVGVCKLQGRAGERNECCFCAPNYFRKLSVDTVPSCGDIDPIPNIDIIYPTDQKKTYEYPYPYPCFVNL